MVVTVEAVATAEAVATVEAVAIWEVVVTMEVVASIKVPDINLVKVWIMWFEITTIRPGQISLSLLLSGWYTFKQKYTFGALHQESSKVGHKRNLIPAQ